MPWKSVNQWNGSNNSGLIVIVRLCLVTVFIGNMEPVDVAKVAAMFILSLLPILLGVVPIFIVSRMKLMPNKNGLSNTAKLVTTCFSCFSGGVLIATALLHLLPEIQEGFTDLNTDQVLVTDLPMAEIMLCCGFFLVYLIEELVHYYADRHAHTRVDATLHRSFSIRGCSISHEGASDGSPAVNNGTTDTADSIRRKKMAAHDFSIKIETENAEKTEKAAAAPAMNAHHSHGLPGAGGKTLPALANFLIVLGLSFHAVFEGIACGLEKTDAEVWQLTAAIASHKLVIAFCIGLDMAINGVRVSLHVSYMVLFGLVTPLGDTLRHSQHRSNILIDGLLPTFRYWYRHGVDLWPKLRGSD